MNIPITIIETEINTQKYIDLTESIQNKNIAIQIKFYTIYKKLIH